MVSSREGFLFSENVAFGRGSVGVECSTSICLNTSGESCLGRLGGEEYNKSRVAWKTFRNCSGCG